MNREFLAFTYKIPSEPSKNRVFVWRTIKELGAVYLQQGVALLPYDKELYSTLLTLREQVHSLGGKSSLGKMIFPLEDDEKEILSEFTAQIDGEYQEFIRNCGELLEELNHESSSGDFNFSEITENEEEYKKFQRWFGKIIRKDYFQSALRNDAEKILEQANQTLQKYSDEVYRRDSK